MPTEKLNLFLGLWGALLSTILAFIAITKFRKENQPHLFVDADINTDEDITNWSIYLCNISDAPIVVISYSVGFGLDKNYQVELKKENIELTLTDAKPNYLLLNREEIIASFNRKRSDGTISNDNLKYNLLWINIKLSQKKVITQVVSINPSLFQIGINPKYDQYVATGKFLGYDLTNDFNASFIEKRKYINK